MTYAIPTPAEFLAQTDPDEPEDEFDDRDLGHRLAELEGRVCALEQAIVPAVLDTTVTDSALVDDLGDELAELGRELADLEAKHGDVLELIEEIRGIVKTSTSKVSLEVKAAIGRWANPVVVGDPVEPPKTSAEPEAVEDLHSGCEDRCGPGCRFSFGTPPEPLPLEQPAHDADTIVWRAYAKSLGRTDAELAMANRSMIRTMLGIEQPAGQS